MTSDREEGSDEFRGAWEQLQAAKQILEKHYRDACDVEFVIQHGQLFITGVRIAKRSPRAAIRIALDLLAEGVITKEEVIERLRLNDIVDSLGNEISNRAGLRLLFRGLPASQGAATGRLVIVDREPRSRPRFERPGLSTILLAEEFSPEDLPMMLNAAGLIAIRGGLTSHAAVIARGRGLPCVTGAGDIELDLTKRLARSAAGSCGEGEWLTVDGSLGEIYLGKAHISRPEVARDAELLSLSRVIEAALLEGSLGDGAMAKAWLVRDILCHSWTPSATRSSLGSPLDHVAHPGSLLESDYPVESHPEPLRPQFCSIYEGFLFTLTRLLGEYAGIGKHWQFMRPLWDPMTAVKIPSQFVGLFFFHINHFVPHLLDISTIELTLRIGVDNSNDLWRFDTINPRGDSIIPAGWGITGSRLLVNNGAVDLFDVPAFYHSFRRREYYSHLCEANGTSRSEIIDLLRSGAFHGKANTASYSLAFRLGLIRNQRLTETKRSLVTSSDDEKAEEELGTRGDHYSATIDTLERIVDHALERGYEDREVHDDDYALLLKRREFRDVVIGELYGTYFPPGRHEFDYLLLKEFVDAIAHDVVITYVSNAVATGLVGATAYKLANRLATVVANRFRGKDRERASIWKSIVADIGKIENFFQGRETATIQDIEKVTGIERERLTALLKLLKFKYVKGKGRTGWTKRAEVLSM